MIKSRQNVDAWCRAFIVMFGVSTLTACRPADGVRRERQGPGVISIDTGTRYQTMTGWEAVAQAGQGEPQYSAWRDELIIKAVDELGLNRLRLEVTSGSENSTDFHAAGLQAPRPDYRCERYITSNDNSDPSVIQPAGFHFSRMDSTVVKLVLPLKKYVEDRGEKLFINLNYVAFIGQCGDRPFDYVHDDPAEYAEFILAAFLHLRDRFGIVPDAVEVILEPDNVAAWSGQLIGQAIVHTAARLAAAGFRPTFVAPSTSSMAEAITYSRQMLLVPGVSSLVSELSYHRYRGVSKSNLRALASLAARHGMSTAMLEHIGSDVEDLYADVTIGGASAWQQFTLGHPAADNGAQYYTISGNRPYIGSRTRYLRQYFRYVRRGARRVAASSAISGVKAAAFVNTDGRIALVIHAPGARRIEIRGLAAGRYGASITTERVTGFELGEVTANETGVTIVDVPDEGVLTVYGK